MHETELLVFRDALSALDAGDTGRLEQQLHDFAWLGRYSCRVGDLYEHGYFAGARLLWHVAGNPDRGPLPPNIVAVTRVLARHAAWPEDVEQTVGLILTSRRASEAGVALQLIDVLKGDGSFDVTRPGLLDEPLLNAAPGTAVALIERGATVELRHASALGDVEAATRLVAGSPSGETLEEALAFACISGQRETASLLVERGARGDMLLSPGGQSPRTALHEAANRGHADIVLMLLNAGSDPTVVDSRWHGNAAGWAEEGGHPDIATLLRLRENDPR